MVQEGGKVKLTPIEIKNQEFKKGMRGYDTVEVDTFIELVADKYQELLETNEKLIKQNLVYETELGNYREVEKTLKTTLQNMQESKQMSKENSQKEAGLIKKEAELAAAQLLEKTRLQVHKMREELVSLQNQKHSFISRLKHVLASQMELLDILETDDISIQRLKDRTKPAIKKPVNVNPATSKSAILGRTTATPPKPAAQTPEENKEKTHGEDLFNDIFGDNQENEDDLK